MLVACLWWVSLRKHITYVAWGHWVCVCKSVCVCSLPSLPHLKLAALISLFSLPTVCLLRALYCLALVVSDLVAFLNFSTTLNPLRYPPSCLRGEPELHHLTISPCTNQTAPCWAIPCQGFRKKKKRPSQLYKIINHHREPSSDHPLLPPAFVSTSSHLYPLKECLGLWATD